MDASITLPPDLQAPPDLAAIAVLRAELWQSGYRPLAVYSHDARHESAGKAPLGLEWERRARQDPPEAATWPALRHAANTGILADGLRAVDIDIDDPDLAARLRETALRLLGDAPLRFRENSGRCLLVYRAAAGEPPKRVLAGTAGKIEVLGRGQQFVAYGTHPSGAALCWHPEPLQIVPRATLPAVTEGQVGAFLAAAAPLIGAEAPKAAPAGHEPHPGTGAAQADILDVIAALAVIQNKGAADWEHWNAVGMAAWAASAGAVHGFNAWCAWSSRNAAFDLAACRARWAHYETSPPTQTGAGKLYKMAAAAVPGWRRPSEAGSGGTGEPLAWGAPDMSVLRLNRRSPPPLPLEIFGPWGNWISGVAEAAACPPDYVAAPLLATASALIGNSRWAQATPGWSEPPHLWCATVGDSGTGKSPGSDCLLRDVLPEIERRMLEDYPDRLKDWKAAAERAKAGAEAWQQEVRTAHKAGTAAPLPPDPEPAEPQAPRVRVNDVTVEKVASLLATAAPKGMLIVRDELAGWLLGLNSYNDSGRAFWIEAYGGRPYRVERQKSPLPIIVPRLAVAVAGGTQPERLAALMGDADDGLLARIIWTWPDPVPFRLGREAPGVAWATACLDRLRLLDLGPGAEPDGAPQPVMVPLAPEALPMIEGFAQDMQARQAEASGLMRSAYGKARGLALRLSLVLESLWWCAADGFAPPPARISARAFAAAATLVADYFIPMAERTYGDAAIPDADRHAATLARWIVLRRPAEVHVRLLQREVRLPGLNTADAIHEAAAVLVEADWLRPPVRSTQAGRAKAAYSVNPGLREPLQ